MESIRKKFEIADNLEFAPTLEAEKAQYFDEMIQQLKVKSASSTMAEKYLALSVLPSSWSLNKVKNEFHVSKNLAQTVKAVVAEHGILTPPPSKPGKSLPKDTVALVEQFYTSDQISRMQPGKKDFVTLRVNGEKTTVG